MYACMHSHVHVIFMCVFSTVANLLASSHRCTICNGWGNASLVSAWVPIYWNGMFLFRSASTFMETHEIFNAAHSKLYTATPTTTTEIKLVSMLPVRFDACRWRPNFLIFCYPLIERWNHLEVSFIFYYQLLNAFSSVTFYKLFCNHSCMIWLN